jgi:transcriptional regulator with XRE-family HTH domain
MLSKMECSLVIGATVRKLRMDRKMTILSLAHQSGLEYSQVSRIENGKINTSIYQLYLISRTLQVEVSDICEVLNSSSTSQPTNNE